jgi:hypothetical protein
MPSAHRRDAAWSPERFARWARSIGPNTEGLVVAVLAMRDYDLIISGLDYGSMTLAEAREEARNWLKFIDKGLDPQTEKERQDEERRKEEQQRQQEELRKQRTAFAAVAEDFIKEKRPGERKGHEAELDIRGWSLRATLKSIGALRLRIVAHEIMISEAVPVLHQVIHHSDYLAGLGAAVLGTSQSAADHLHVPHGAEYRTGYDDRRGLWRVESCREHLVIGEHLNAAVEEVADEILAHRHVGIRIDGRRWHA